MRNQILQEARLHLDTMEGKLVEQDLMKQLKRKDALAVVDVKLKSAV
jgi:hypothetical protein